MNANDYQQIIRQWQASPQSWLLEQLNFALGLAGEAGEVADLIKKVHFHGKDVSIEMLTSELGDVLWYVAALADAFSIPLSKVMEQNIAKLEARYPNGFVLGGGNR